MRDLLAGYFLDLDRAMREGRPRIAWCSSVGPAELLISLGFAVFFPENHAAMLGAARQSARTMSAAHAAGYSPDICSYLTSDIGAFLRGETPLAKAYPGIQAVPRPDVLVYNNVQCRDVQDWFAWYGRKFGVPVLGIAAPRQISAVTPDLLTGLAGQFRALVPPLEAVAGRRLDVDGLRSVMEASRRGSGLWRRVLEANRAAPAPMSFFDAVIQMAPAVVLRGRPDAPAYYEVLLRELEGRAARGEGAIDGERFRLYWEGLPIWGRLRSLAEFFFGLRTAVVASTYCNSWIFEGDDDDPFLAMARASAGLFIARDEDFKERYLRDMAGRYGIHGFLFHDAKTCPGNSNNRPYNLDEDRISGLQTLILAFISFEKEIVKIDCSYNVSIPYQSDISQGASF
ncbi:MAG: 2-hydroxyacyl-CoA dehydratase family protein [Candidatus Aminicenantales bacterium]